MFSTLLAVAFAMQSPSALFEYLARPSPEFAWSKRAGTADRTDLEVASHVWQGNLIRHGVTIVRPPRVEHTGIAMLVVTGGPVNERDVAEARALAKASGMAVATVFDIPNQPLFDLREDALIAHTFVKFLETGDATWPLLFPMVKGTLHAMDAVQAWASESGEPLKRFVVTGASKRGWTTWFLGAARDSRVVGIAPEVYDNLDLLRQMKHQIDSFGGFSERIGDYSSRDLMEALETEAGKRLAEIVDPFSYRADIGVPTLVVTGTNDPYWPVDAMSLYWDRLPMPHWARSLPNNGHTFSDKDAEISVLGAFARSCAGEFALPRFEWTLTPDSVDGSRAAVASLKGEGVGFARFAVWTASSKTLDFRESKWTETAQVSVTPPSAESAPFAPSIRFLLPEENAAVLPVASFRIGGRDLTLTLPVRVVRARR